MKNLLKLLLFAAVAPMLFCGCDELKSRLDVAESETGELKVEISQLEKTVADLSDLKAALEVKVTELERQLAAAGDEDAALSSRIDELKETIEELEGNIAGLRTLIDGKVSYAEYAEFVAEVTESLKTLGRVESLCAGFPDGKTVKEYIDDAVAALTSASGSYMLKTEFEEFYGQYSAFVAAHHSAVEALEREIASLEAQIDAIPAGPDMTPYENQIKELQNRIDALEQDKITMDQVKELFDTETQVYFDSIKEEIESMVDQKVQDLLTEDELNAAVENAIQKLTEEYADKVDNLRKDVDALTVKVDALLKRIQSLVYVPETSDGKIHIGTSYIAEIKEGNKSSTKIEVTSTHKIKYRVSPADLSTDLVSLYRLDHESFSFWQEHVSRVYETQAATTGLHISSAETVASRADAREGHDGVHEFNIVDVEEVENSPGVIQITVDNEHAFDHEDLAVALCIKHEDAETGVLTEYVSAYTTVVGTGSNLVDRFHLAKNENGSYTKVSRTDRVDYIVIYDDTTPIKLMDGYEVAYDDGENVISLAEAKEKYGWDEELKYTIKHGTVETVSSNGKNFTSYTITPADWKNQLEAPLSFQMKDGASASDVGAQWSINYKVLVSKGTESVPIHDIKACVTVVPSEYEVSADVFWNGDNFFYGKSYGWQSTYASYTVGTKLTYKNNSNDVSASNLPVSVYNDVFSDTPWTLGEVPQDIQKENLNVTALMKDGKLSFNVKGFKFCEGSHSVSLSRNDIATSGSKKISVTGNLTFKGPEQKDLNITLETSDSPRILSVKKEDYEGIGNGFPYALAYMSAASGYGMTEGNNLPLSTDFFNSEISFFSATVKDGIVCTKQDGGDNDAPARLKLRYHDKSGGRPMVLLRSINVTDEKGSLYPDFSSISQETTYTFEGFDITIPEGPTIHVAGGAFKFVPKN